MTRNKILVRMMMLIIVTAVFITSFYFFFKNSRAGSPLSDKEYMEQLSAASKRYNTTGTDIDELTDNNMPPIGQENESTFFDKVVSFINSILQ